jgi:hypothetical protein
MRPPPPWAIAAILAVLVFNAISRGPSGTGAEAAGYLFGSLFIPALVAVLYTRWYRRRTPPSE